MDEARDLIAVLKADKKHLQAKVDGLCEWLFSMDTLRVHRAENIAARAEKRNLREIDTLESNVVMSTTNPTVQSTLKSKNRPDATSSENKERTEVVTPSFKHPKGFKELKF